MTHDRRAEKGDDFQTLRVLRVLRGEKNPTQVAKVETSLARTADSLDLDCHRALWTVAALWNNRGTDDLTPSSPGRPWTIHAKSWRWQPAEWPFSV